MDTHDTKQDKQITIAVPEDRVPEFYAFYGRFLAGGSRRRGHRGPPGRDHGHDRCGHRHEEWTAETTAPPEAQGTA